MAKVIVPFSCYSVIYKWLILVISVKTEIKGSRILVFSRFLNGWEGKERNEPNYADSGTSGIWDGGGGLFNLAEKTMVSVLHKELGYKIKKHKYKKLEVMQLRIKNQFKLQVGE